MQIVGLAGFAQVGKDTMGAHLVHNHGFTRVAMADKLKIDYCNQVGITIDQLAANKEEHRPAIVELSRQRKDESNDEAYWIKKLWEEVDNLPRSANIVVTDVRYDFEVSWINANGGVTVWIERPGIGPANLEEEIFTRPIRSLCHDWVHNGDLTESQDELEYILKRQRIKL